MLKRLILCIYKGTNLDAVVLFFPVTLPVNIEKLRVS